MNVLLVSTYEAGFQSIGVTIAATHLLECNIETCGLDLSVQTMPPIEHLCRFSHVGFYLPMFHSVPIAVRIARRLQAFAGRPKIFFYGLYADLFRKLLLERFGDYVLGTDWEDQIGPFIDNEHTDPSVVKMSRRGFVRQRKYRAPTRHILPGLDKYAKLIDEQGEVLAGAVETTRGCAHLCTHCPIPPVYGGKVSIVDQSVILQDIDKLVEMGARHIAFLDADFLNVPRHSLSIVKAMHKSYPFLTYDFVAKVSHLRRHEGYVRELAPLGLRFALTAMEFSNNRVLSVLQKNHDVDDLDHAINLFREIGVFLRPTFVMVNPWTEPDELLGLLQFIESRDLVRAIDPVQYKIRLLLFNGSPLLDDGVVSSAMTASGDFYFDWNHRNPLMEVLHRDITNLVNSAMKRSLPNNEIFAGVKNLVLSAVGLRQAPPSHAPSWLRAPLIGKCPRYDVPNYCCTEPVEGLEDLKGML